MSWQAYVDSLMMPLEGGHGLTSGAICGLDGGVWAQSDQFPPTTTNQLVAIAGGFNGEDGLKELTKTNIELGEDKYFVVHSEPERVIRAKCGKNCLVIQRTNKAMVVGVGTEPGVSFGETAKIVEGIAESLISYDY